MSVHVFKYYEFMNMAKASEHGTYINDDIMSNSYGHVPIVYIDIMSKASEHDLYIYGHVIVRCLGMDIQILSVYI